MKETDWLDFARSAGTSMALLTLYSYTERPNIFDNVFAAIGASYGILALVDLVNLLD